MGKTIHLTVISLLVLSLQTVGVAAPNTLNFQTVKPSSAPVSPAPIPPADFAKQVKTVNAENHTQFKQQLDQRKGELSNPTILSLSQVQTMSQTTPPPVVSSGADESPPDLPTNSTASKSMPKSSHRSSNPPAIAPTANEASSPPAQTPAHVPPPQPVQPYTGFQAQTPSSAAPKSSGGFSISY